LTICTGGKVENSELAGAPIIDKQAVERDRVRCRDADGYGFTGSRCDPAKAVRLNADPTGDGQRSVANRIEHIDFAMAGAVLYTCWKVRQGWFTVQGSVSKSLRRRRTPVAVRGRHAGKCGCDECEKNCRLGHG
jgi:hypothetical protein